MWQVKRLEILLNKCKETIKNNKERSGQLIADKEAMQQQLDEKEQTIQKIKVCNVLVGEIYPKDSKYWSDMTWSHSVLVVRVSIIELVVANQKL